jgi:hypothetical protein
MAFNVNQFRSQLTGDGARPNLFECTLTFPVLASSGGAASPGAIQDNVGLTEKFTFMARAAQLPGSTVNQIPVNYFGRELKFSGNRTFPEWTVTIINDEDFKLRDAFEKWMHGLNSHVTNTRGASFRNALGYQQDGLVTQYGKSGEIIKEYNFVGMFPIDVSPIELDWGANDAIEEYAVTFAYQWWESNTTERSFRNF